MSGWWLASSAAVGHPAHECDRLGERGELEGPLERTLGINPTVRKLHSSTKYPFSLGSAHMDTKYLIVGGGMTADAAVKGIREHDADGSIVLVGAEPHPPYKRPPLTKGLWSGGDEAKIWKNTADAGAELILGRRIVALDLAAPARHRRPGRRLRLREAPARDRRHAAASRRCGRPGHLLPHARRLPEAQADHRRRRERRRHRRRLHRLGARGVADERGCEGDDGLSRGGCHRRACSPTASPDSSPATSARRASRC